MKESLLLDVFAHVGFFLAIAGLADLSMALGETMKVIEI